MRSGSIPKVVASDWRFQLIIWFEVQTVMSPPSDQSTVEVCGSIITWLWPGVRYIWSVTAAALRNAASTSPTSVSGAPEPSSRAKAASRS